MARPLQHLLDALFGRKHYRQKIRPVIVDKQPLEVVLRVGREQPRRGSLKRDAFQILFGERAGQPLDHLLHEGTLRDRICSFDVGA
jgi:hypothetical protein